MAFGLDEQRLLAQWEEVDRLNEELGGQLRVLKDIECDILEQGADGRISGVMSDGYMAMQMLGATEASGISGNIVSNEGAAIGFVGELQDGNSLTLTLFPYDQFGNPDPSVSETLILVRQGTAVAGTRPEAPDASAEPAPASREVYINRVRLDEQTIRAMEAQYQIPIQAGRYWYDSNCGAWGVEGGPTAGFIYAGLNLPGPMPTERPAWREPGRI